MGNSFLPEDWGRMAKGVWGVIAALLVTWLFLWGEKKSFGSIGLKLEFSTIVRFIYGLITGVIVMGLLTGGVIYFSGFKISPNPGSNLPHFLAGSIVLLPLALMEEIGFRAYPLQTLKQKTSTRSAIVISAMLFALYHMVYGWSLQTAFLGAGAWGIIFSTAALHFKGIAMPAGMHFAVNLTTAAFDQKEGSFHLWILKQGNGASLEGHKDSPVAILIPQLIILLLGIILMEWLIRMNRKQEANKKIL
jgi:membrane protease YdiL (CAAX protease family)